MSSGERETVWSAQERFQSCQMLNEGLLAVSSIDGLDVFGRPALNVSQNGNSDDGYTEEHDKDRAKQDSKHLSVYAKRRLRNKGHDS